MVRLQRLRVADQADALFQTSPDTQTALLKVLPIHSLGQMIGELIAEDAAAVCERVADDRLPAVLDASGSDMSADVLKCLAPDAAAALASMGDRP